MTVTRLSFALVAGLLASTAGAQTSKKPLNLYLSPADVTPAAAGSSSYAPASTSTIPDKGRAALPPNVVPAGAKAQGRASTSTAVSDAPGVYYGDHSTDIGEDDTRPSVPPCDDYTYNKPQVHGSISTGIVSGSHIGTGSYSGGVVSVSKAFGSCEHPGGGISISVGGTTTDGFGRHWGH